MTPISKALIVIGAASMVAGTTIASAAGAGNALIALGGPNDGQRSPDDDRLSALAIAGIITGLVGLGFLINGASKSN